MLVVHAAPADGRLFCWAEHSSPTAPPKPRRGRKSTARPLPFAASELDIRLALAQTVPGTNFNAEPESICVWLPTIDDRPFASSPMIAEPPASLDGATITPWLAPAMPLTPTQAALVLGACLDRPILVPGVAVGSTLAFWSAALRFAAALVAREQFLPDVADDEKVLLARWSPHLAGPESRRFHQLARAMPAAGRALTLADDVPPDRPAVAVLGDFLTLMVDALVRPDDAAAPPGGKVKFNSLHDQWLHALRRPDAAMKAPLVELEKLQEQVRTWQQPAALLSRSPFRLCFRLEEPPPPTDEDAVTTDGVWKVRYLLQAQDDPSLLVPAGDVWTAKGATAAVLNRDGFKAREFLLAALGQAVSVAPQLGVGLRGAAPESQKLDTRGAMRFLSESATALGQAGFGVLLPAWWTGKGTKQKIAAKAHVSSSPMSEGSGGLSLEDLVQFEWRVAVGDRTMTLSELETLARLKTPLVQVRGQWVQVSAEDIQAALAMLKKGGSVQTTVGMLVRLDLIATKIPGGLDFAGVQATGSVGELLDQIKGKASFVELPPPKGLKGTLRPYQVRGFSWLAFLTRWGLGACLADDMGLGKTVQTLAFLQREREEKTKAPFLLVCPMSVVGNWKKEAERFTPALPVLIHHGQKRAKGDAFKKQAMKHSLVLTSYSLLDRDLALLQTVSWAGVILDEAQNIKNPATKQAKAACALQAGRRIVLTGTPVENHVGDIWSIWQFLNPGFLGGRSDFQQNFYVPIQFQRSIEAADRLKRLTGPFLLRRLKTDKSIIADLPEKLEMKVYCNLTREQASLYQAVVKDMEKGIGGSDGIQRKGIILGALSKLKQVCNHPAQFLGDGSAIPDRSGKLARLTEMIEELLDAGERALVFTQFTEMGEIIRTHLQESFGREVLFLHGGTPRAQRDRMVARFQEEGPQAPPIFLLSLKAGGTGLNLTAASHVFHFDRWWNPAVENQATDRAFRIGQQKKVQVHKFVCVGTLEEKIDEMIERKQSVASQVVGTGEAWLTELSNDELREAFALREDAVGD